jgi:hypothetical protein
VLLDGSLPEHGIEGLKEGAPTLGFGGGSGADLGVSLEWAEEVPGGTGQGECGGEVQ